MLAVTLRASYRTWTTLGSRVSRGLEADMRMFVRSAAMMIAGAIAPAGLSAQVDVERDDRVRVSPDAAPAVDLWLDQISFDRGARMKPHVTTEPGAYVVVLKVTTEGQLSVLYPDNPLRHQPYYAERIANDAVPYRGSTAFLVNESRGNGFVFAIASYERFDFSEFTRGPTWNYARLASFNRRGDPFEIARRFIDEVLPQTADFSLDYEMYEVYSRGLRGQYTDLRSISYWGIDEYYSSCLNAFGYRMDYYCQPYRGRYYGPIIIASNPRAPRPRNPVNPGGKRMKPPEKVGHDPVVPKSPVTPVEGTVAEAARAENALRDYERRLRAGARASSPQPEARRIPEPRQPVIYRSVPQREQRPEPPRQQPRAQEPQRSEPRAPVGTVAPREHQVERARSKDKS